MSIEFDMTEQESILSYRNKHKRCRYCIYQRCNLKGNWLGIPDFWECTIKDNRVEYNSIAAKFCKYYKVKLVGISKRTGNDE